jgi:predicted acylesterase/phospholipase RssA
VATIVPKEAVDVVAGDKPKHPQSGGRTGLATAGGAAQPAPARNVLVLSGGGADGAFGAGLLIGWRDSGRRPDFEIVTGVSTGAFMAALVFAGPKYDPTLRELYTNRSSADLYIDKGASGLASQSLYDDTPLRKEIERVVTPAFLADVAAEHAKGRRLYVATTNLDAGELVVWDMGQIATGDRADPLQMFQKVLRASAAVPGFFPPVYIKPQKGKEARQAHVDGGVKAPLLLRTFMLEQKVPGRTIHVVVNGSLSRFNYRKPVGTSVTDIGRKSIAELLRTTLDQSLYQAYVLARNAGSDFNLLAIPDDVEPSVDALTFDKAKMRVLFRAAYDIGKSGRPWLKEPPRLAEGERVKGPGLAAAPVIAAKPSATAAPSALARSLASER